MTPRTALHTQHTKRIAAILRRLGATDVERGPASSAISLICDGTPIGVRVATARVQRQRITQAGKTYSYSYPKWHWNLHVRSTRVPVSTRSRAGQWSPGVAVWVLVAVGDGETRDYVVPAGKLGGKSASLLCGSSGGKSQLTPYRDEWGVLVPVGRRRRAA